MNRADALTFLTNERDKLSHRLECADLWRVKILINLDEIKARAEAATQGEWEYDYAGCVSVYDEKGNHGFDICECEDICTENAEANGEFIAHAREDIPALIAALEAKERELQEFKNTCFTPLGILELQKVSKANAEQNAQLREQLTAAMEDMKFIHCAGRYGCEICLNNEVCKMQNSHIGKCDNFDWRGTKGAE